MRRGCNRERCIGNADATQTQHDCGALALRAITCEVHSRRDCDASEEQLRCNGNGPRHKRGFNAPQLRCMGAAAALQSKHRRDAQAAQRRRISGAVPPLYLGVGPLRTSQERLG